MDNLEALGPWHEQNSITVQTGDASFDSVDQMPASGSGLAELVMKLSSGTMKLQYESSS